VEPASVCAHGEAPADAALGVVGRRTSAGVQEAVGFLAAEMPLAVAAESFRRLLPLEMTGRQGEALIQPVGEALLAKARGGGADPLGASRSGAHSG
jgi:hypothetical protein